ncbi:MAG TPA: serine hydrolase domain-containing protein, partial [Deltaproteobacteria bacterium]|nr:serine hydrolase domain-containing protein [Deltaproteobacteria bacterium]
MSRLSLFIATSCGALLLTMTSCHVGRYFWRNVADINDYRIFPADTIAAAASARHFAQSASPADDPPKAGLNTSLDLIRLLELTRSTAFLVLENDTLRMQWYGEGFDSTSILPSFSIAKSVLSVSIAMAVAEGSLPSIETRVQRYLPEGMDTSLGKLSFRHLLDMRAGLNFKERYHTPFSPMAKFYYGRRLHRYMRNLRVIREPGHEYEYQGAASQIAGIALEQAIGRSYCEFLSERLFEPAG